MHRRIHSLVMVTFIVAAFGEPQTAGAATPFTIDPNLSTLTVSASALGSNATPQAPGSDTTRFSGTLLANVNGNQISFPGGSTILALNQPSAMQPAPGGGAGGGPANYGLNFSAFLSGGPVAVRDLTADVTSGAIQLNSGVFDATRLHLTTTNGAVDYNITGLFSFVGRTGIAGNGADNAAGPGGYANALGIETLTIPIRSSFSVAVGGGVNVDVTLTGQLVGTHAVPEPGTLTLAGIALVTLIPILRRLRRKKF